MGTYNPEQDGVREPARKAHYLAEIRREIKAGFDADVLVDIASKGEDEFLRVAHIIYGANGFEFFTPEDYRELYRWINHRAFRLWRRGKVRNNEIDAAYRTTLTPAEQMLAFEKEQARDRRLSTSWGHKDLKPGVSTPAPTDREPGRIIYNDFRKVS